MCCVAVSHKVSFSDNCIPPVIQNLYLHFKSSIIEGNKRDSTFDLTKEDAVGTTCGADMSPSKLPGTLLLQRIVRIRNQEILWDVG